MATQRQIDANKANATRSTGPRTASGAARSRFNAVKHGLAGESSAVEAGRSPEFAERRGKWLAEQGLTGEGAHWAFDKAVAASLQIDRCEVALDEVMAASRERARLAWDLDRQVEAATTFGRLAADPVLASRQLQTSLTGAKLLVETWLGLVAAFEAGRDWSESEASRALDLLGVAPDLRSARTLIDAPEGTDPVAFRLALALEEVDRLEALAEEVLAPLDEMDQKLAVSGELTLLSKPAALVLRYERDAWRRYRESMKAVKAEAPSPVVVTRAPTPTPRPAVVPPRPSQPAPTAAPSRSFEEERRALLAEVAPIRKAVIDDLIANGFEGEDAWLDELERRIEAMPLATERTQFVDFAVGRSS